MAKDYKRDSSSLLLEKLVRLSANQDIEDGAGSAWSLFLDSNECTLKDTPFPLYCVIFPISVSVSYLCLLAVDLSITYETS